MDYSIYILNILYNMEHFVLNTTTIYTIVLENIYLYPPQTMKKLVPSDASAS